MSAIHFVFVHFLLILWGSPAAHRFTMSIIFIYKIHSYFLQSKAEENYAENNTITTCTQKWQSHLRCEFTPNPKKNVCEIEPKIEMQTFFSTHFALFVGISSSFLIPLLRFFVLWQTTKINGEIKYRFAVHLLCLLVSSIDLYVYPASNKQQKTLEMLLNTNIWHNRIYTD